MVLFICTFISSFKIILSHHGIDAFILLQMDTVKIEPFTENSEQRTQTEQNLLLFLRMRQMQNLTIPGLGLKRSETEASEQPLDFSAAKQPRLSPISGFPRGPDNKHDSLGSDAVSDASSHSPRSESDSPRSDSQSPRSNTDSTSPAPGTELPSLSIPSPVPAETTDSSINKSEDSLLSLAPRIPLLKPLSALTEPSTSAPSILPMSFPFSSLPVFPQIQKPSFPPAPQLPFPFPVAPASEMTKLSMDSQDKYNEFRERMLRNMEAGAKLKRSRGHEVSTSSGTEDSNVSLDTSASNGGPQHHSTPTRDGKDAAYWERRRKNNEAAKRSRDARRMKENEVAVRASFLEQENIQLKMELVQLRTELGAMRDQITGRPL